MSSPDEPGKPAGDVERRRRAAELLGDLLPDTTRDESPEGWGERESTSRDDDFLRDVPPHHG